MRNKLLITLIFTLFFSIFAQAQRLSEFSEVPEEYLKQLGEFMTSSKRDVMKKAFKTYEEEFKKGTYNDEEFLTILKTSNAMLQQKMNASPFFLNYLKGLTVVKKRETGEQLFKDWHAVLNGMLEDIENRKLTPIKQYLAFSHNFFEENNLQNSTSGGVIWKGKADKYELQYVEKTPIVKYEELDLSGFRKKDTIVISKTSGIFYPVDKLWKGEGGKVNWSRFGLKDSIYAELDKYELEVKKSIYRTNNVKLHYPEIFPDGAITGKFEDKIVSENRATEGSYPRFESKDSILLIKNLGPGIEYVGGFRLHGTTVYGYGSKKHKARISIYDENKKLTFKGDSELFVIRKGEKIAAERLEMVMYFNQDSIFHPSVNIKFNIPKQEMELYRGKRGSDRNPFYNSLHKMNVHVEKLEWHMASDSLLMGTSAVSFSNQSKVTFESLNFFKESDFRQIQNISTNNPLYSIRHLADEEGSRFLSANNVAAKINSRFDASSIQSLLYDLVARGFVNYDNDEQIVEVKEKVFHYTDASAEKVDFDVLKVESKSDSTNAVMNLNDNSIETIGVTNVEFSEKQQVALKPTSGRLALLENRNLDFDGRLFAGFSTLEGKQFSYIYDQNHIEMDSVRFFDLFIPTGEKDEHDLPIAMSIASRIEHTSGVLLIDAPNNKSGKEEIEMFPSFNTNAPSYVFYDYKETQEGCYKRDSFYFKLDKFSFNKLDDYSEASLSFDGKMISSDIFPEFKETIVLREEDGSLGFVNTSPTEGYPCYTSKGKYFGEIDLSNTGFLGKGKLDYLTSSVNSEDIVFKPKQMLATADRFDMTEQRGQAVEFPQAVGYDVSVDWKPYRDSMYIRTKEKAFELFKAENYTVVGSLILTPQGLNATGAFEWDQGILTSKLMSFGAFSARADTSNLKIKAFGSDELAFDTRNVNSDLDFDTQIGRIKANSDDLSTTMPYNQYQTSMNELYWDMKQETITFKNEGKEYGDFLSIDPNQDSLTFKGKTALYDLKTNELKIGGVPYIQTCDAYVYTETGDIEVEKGGVMTTLNNARIVADTLSKYHVINRATVDVMGKKDYRAKGYYEYNIGPRKQEIYFADIIGTRVKKGKRSEKPTVTRANGSVTEDDKFYIDHKTEFQGKIGLNADSKNLTFDGFARFDAPLMPSRQWFSVKSDADKKDLMIEYDVPKNFAGERLRNGLFLSKERATLYPRVMMPTYLRKDRAVIDARGLVKYDKSKDEFLLGDSMKISTPTVLRGNMITYSNKDNTVKAEGKFDIGSGLDYISVTSSGTAQTAFDGENTTAKFQAELMAGISMIIPDKLMKIIVTDLISSSYDARPVDYLKDESFYKKALSEFITKNKDFDSAVKKMKSTGLDLPKKYDKYSFFFSKLPMTWNSEYQSFVSTENVVAVSSVGGQPINRHLTCFVEFKMPSNGDDRVYVYIKSPSDFYYYFGFKQGILSTVSNNTKYNDELLGLKKKELTIKMDDGEFYEIQPVAPGRAEMFSNRVKQGRN